MNEHGIDLLIRNARLDGSDRLFDIAIREGTIAAVETNLRCDTVETVDAQGALACGGLVESHIHLDKAGILGRCTICHGTLAEAVQETARAKAAFSERDVYDRAAEVVKKAITNGTMRMRTFVEIDPRAELRSFEAIKRIRRDYAFAIDIEICAFAQDGLTNEPETLSMIDHALSNGADLVGGAPYIDRDPRGHIAMIFDLAEKHDVAADFHLDFDLYPERSNLSAVVEETIARGWQGRVSLGHMTSISALAPDGVVALAERLAEAGIAVTVLPSTDLFLNGRDHDRLVPRGVAPAHVLAHHGVVTSIASNNILNPFTPYGDASLVRMANLYANVLQISRAADLRLVFDMIGSSAAQLMGKPHGIRQGQSADIILLDCRTPEDAIRENARPLWGCRRGRPTFQNARPVIFKP
ncbi:amidohydrolase [Rhizobium sp. Root708]|uniref:amidohydrolase family protein n=1 Tax=Rhizobium sp. Root708 TaxID=1736592 RepID=UPI0006F8151C|nr:amidohydrolase family protein [Rhizobium sp. Root708]KRB60099.1 amidohydrolase [Rhizobium sp. Root708]